MIIGKSAPIFLLLAFLCLCPAPTAASWFMCSACHAVCDVLQTIFTSDYYIQYEREKQLKSCGLDPVICAQFFDHNDVVSVRNYIKRYSANVLCPELGFCDSPKVVRQSLAEYKRKALFNKPPRRYESAKDWNGVMRFAAITDLHIDPNYTQTKSTHCKSSICCRNDSPDIKGPADTPGKWGHVGDCDMPFRTIHNTIDTIWEHNNDVKFIVWLGDNPANAYYAMNPSDHKMIITNVTNKLLEHYNKLGSVYPLFGNHEGLPRDHMPFEPNQTHWLRELGADLWSPWLTPESVQTMRECGHYTQLHPGTKLRIIALNSFVRGSTNSYIWTNITDRCGELSWLNATLEQAEKNGEKALVLCHFPPRDWFSVGRWTARYSVLMERYASVVIGQLAGHTHQDAFQVFKSEFDSELHGVAQELPSVTSSYSVFPSYRVYDIDPDNYQLLDYYQYRLNLTVANANDNPVWTLSYTFRDYYGVKNMEDRTFAWIANKVRAKDMDFTYYKKFAWMLYAEGPNSEQQVKKLGDSHWAYCWLMSATDERYAACQGRSSGDDYDIMTEYLPPWEYLDDGRKTRQSDVFTP